MYFCNNACIQLHRIRPIYFICIIFQNNIKFGSPPIGPSIKLLIDKHGLYITLWGYSADSESVTIHDSNCRCISYPFVEWQEVKKINYGHSKTSKTYYAVSITNFAKRNAKRFRLMLSSMSASAVTKFFFIISETVEATRSILEIHHHVALDNLYIFRNDVSSYLRSAANGINVIIVGSCLNRDFSITAQSISK